MSLDTLIARTLLEREAPPAAPHACALVLMGGGARTAYQAGVLQALDRILRPPHADPATPAPFPFRWLFGTSAGAMGAAFLASRAEHGLGALTEMVDFWRNLRSQHVYRLEAPDWVRANRLVAGWTLARQVRRHRALLDSLPLVDTLHRVIDLRAIERALLLGQLDALGVTASSYTSGEHWTFCQTGPEPAARPWHRLGRRASFEPITIEHLMASGAIPFLFPAVPLWVNGHKEHFGDGSMRQLSPLSPAIHFGALRLAHTQCQDAARRADGPCGRRRPDSGHHRWSRHGQRVPRHLAGRRGAGAARERNPAPASARTGAVSYTHLTLPTKRIV